jgi:nitroreductase
VRESSSPFDLLEVDRLLTTTRAVRKRLDLDRPVEPAVITECLRLATFAPSAGNTQRWRWLVVTDADRRARIAAVYRRLFDRDVGPPPSTADPAAQRQYAAARHLADNLHRVPVHVVPCYLDRPDPGAGNVELSTLYGSIVQAVWSFQLALRSRGLGSVQTTMHLKEEAEVGAILGIPADVTQVSLIPVAYTVGDDFRPPPRLPVDEVTYWDGWARSGR